MLVNPKQVIPSGNSSEWSIRKMVDVLKKQGQIEPLQVKLYVAHTYPELPVYITYIQDVHGSDIVYAAMKLGWDTILVHVDPSGKYEY